MNHPPVCADCKTQMKCKESAVKVLYLNQNDDPYKMLNGDLYYCPDCKQEIVTGYGKNPVFDANVVPEEKEKRLEFHQQHDTIITID